jgi:TrpR-related protein YerC/YecD
MAKPREELQEKEYYKDIYFLYEALRSLKDIDEMKRFTKDIFTSSELRMLKRRWHIANLLAEGHDIRFVAQQTRTSTQTVMKMKLILEEGTGGLLLAMQRMWDKEKRSQTRIIRGGSKYVKGWIK